jgi:hypothetical protein
VQGSSTPKKIEVNAATGISGKPSRPFRTKLPILTQLRYLPKCAYAQLFWSKTSKEPPNHSRNYPRRYIRSLAALKSFALHFFLSQVCNFVVLMSLRTYVRRAATPLSWYSRMTSATMPLKAKISHPTPAGSQKVIRASFEDLHFH